MVNISVPKLQPSLWRTCRVLANRQRLELLQELFRRPDQTVSVLATRLRISVSMASQYLRQLNARGLLQARRVGLHVFYRPSADASVPHARPLFEAIKNMLRTDRNATELIYWQATAFTHPRRLAIVAALARGPRGMADLSRATGMSISAAQRHVDKLAKRGLLASEDGQCRLLKPGSELAATFLRMAQAPVS